MKPVPWLLLVVACGGDDSIASVVVDASADRSAGDASLPSEAGPDAPTDACVGLTVGPTGVSNANALQVGSRKRTYVLSVPANASGQKRLPLVFVWHGDGGTGAGIRGTLNLEAPAKDAAIFVYPDGVQQANGWWDLDSGPPANIDIALFDGLLTELQTHYCIDDKRIFSTGFSRGGFFTNHLACFRGDKLAAIAPQSGGGPYWPNTAYNGDGQLTCPTPPMPALIIHGNADMTVANDPKLPDGGWQSYQHWAYWNHPAPRAGFNFAADPTLPSPCFAAKGLPADHPVIACFIDGLGHEPWSQQASTVWSFFSRF